VVIDGPIGVDMPRVKARKDEIVAQSNGGVTNWLSNASNVTLIRGHGRFESPTTVRAGERLLEAPQIFINTGGRPAVPKLEGVSEVPFLTSTGMMSVDFLPEHLIIVGGSYIGLEFAQMYRRFGSRVTVVEMAPRIVAREDEEVSAALQKMLESEGIDFRLNAECLKLYRHGHAVGIHVNCEEEPRRLEGSHLLLAVGRDPNTHDLGLDAAGVKTERPRLHRGRRRAPHEHARDLGAGRRQRARAPSRTRRTTITRSSPLTFSTTTAAAFRTASPCTRSSPTRRSRGSG
jgi:pyruvate/2-oxoglutarate dehydrogenase complex dihydrolipoamide dehydrogenase (E3) component